MRVLSVNVGRAREATFAGRTVRTGIVKRPVSGPLAVRKYQLEGDEQANLEVHGGVRKAVYAYPSEHYPFWRTELGVELSEWGAFGENLTTVGWPETTARLGDTVGIGTAELEVTQPRFPCEKLNFRFQRPDMLRRFESANRSGFYLTVRREGVLSAGDSIRLLSRRDAAPTVYDVVATRRAERADA